MTCRQELEVRRKTSRGLLTSDSCFEMEEQIAFTFSSTLSSFANTGDNPCH